VFDENSKFVSNDFIKDMKPSITIIGAGISGLSVGLHFEKIIDIVTGLEIYSEND
jgi:predicted NAD/FAD-binding protein